jgi:hypothetical protein
MGDPTADVGVKFSNIIIRGTVTYENKFATATLVGP